MTLIFNAIKNLPNSIMILLFTLIVFILQISAIPGIFLMVLGAPLWSIISVNLAFLLMVFDVKTQSAALGDRPANHLLRWIRGFDYLEPYGIGKAKQGICRRE